MTPSRPYLLRALYEWILDNNATPHILVNAFQGEVQVPQDYVKDGQIVLNIAPSAVKALSLGNELITFNARFRGIPMDISVPLNAVIGIYAKENGRGMMFEEGVGPDTPPQPNGPDSNTPTPRGGGKPSLRVVK
jgi:stringent starvation protein B